MELGIDISVHNGIVNMQKVKDAGYGRVMIRAGYGRNNIDQKYVVNADACRRLLIPAGVYWFSYGYNEAMAKAEGEYAVAAAGKYWDKCPIAFDLEYDTVAYARKNGVEITKALATRMAIAFLRVVVDAGYIPVLYTNKDYKENVFDLPLIQKNFQQKIYIWYARYTKNLNSEENALADIWQKSSTGKVDGINGNVDINEFYTTFTDVQPKAVNETVKNINILDFQKAANIDGFRDMNGAVLKEDGIDGPKTQYVRRVVNLQAKKAVVGYKTGTSGYLVTWWQKRLGELGFTTKMDGSFGADTRKQTIEFQKKYQLKADGIAGYNSITTMLMN